MCLLSSHKRQAHLTSSNLSLILKCSQDAHNIFGFSDINASSCLDIGWLTAIESMVSRAASRLYRITHLIHAAINECVIVPLTTFAPLYHLHPLLALTATFFSCLPPAMHPWPDHLGELFLFPRCLGSMVFQPQACPADLGYSALKEVYLLRSCDVRDPRNRSTHEVIDYGRIEYLHRHSCQQ